MSSRSAETTPGVRRTDTGGRKSGSDYNAFSPQLIGKDKEIPG
jgi:hypothetical protein